MDFTKKEYSLIDVDGLSTCLAEENWKELTKSQSLEDLYKNGKDGLVKDEWANAFFDLKEAIIHLIHYYKKPEDGTAQEGGDNIQRVSI